MSFMDDWKAERDAAYARPRLNCLDCRASGCIDWHDGEPLCDDCRSARERAEVAKYRQRAEASRRENWWGLNDLAHKRGETLESFVVLDSNRKAYEAVKTSVTAPNGVILRGEAGCGKTHLMYGLIHSLLGLGQYIMIVRLDALMQELRDNYGRSQLLEEAMAADNLIIDDLTFKGVPTDFIATPINSMLDHRWQRQLKTWVTTNAGAGSITISEALDGRAPSRILGLCGDPIDMAGPDGRTPEGRKIYSGSR